MAELIASRYASALFDAGKDLDKVSEFYEELKLLREVFKEEEKLIQILSHPKISKNEKKDLIKNIFQNQVSQELINFLYILIDKKREKNILEIIKVYEDLYYDYEGVLRVMATTASLMKEDSKNRLSKVLEEKLNKKILIKNKVEEDIIGGVKLEIEGKLIDGTIKGKLDAMAKLFKAATN